MHDVIIVGGGPAGLTAGLYTSRAKLDSILIDKGIPGGQLLNTENIEDYPGFESITGMELAKRMEDQAKKFGLIIENDEAIQIRVEGKEKVVKCINGEYRGKAVIVATGGSPNKLNIPGEKEFAGKGVSYCAICDGAFFKDEDIAVVGGGDAAVEEALFLTKFGKKVYIIHRRDRLRASKFLQERAFSHEKIEVIWNSVVKEVKGNGRKVISIIIKNVLDNREIELKVDGIFIFIGFTPNSKIFKDDIKLDSNGYIITDGNMET